mmetsp:Transcript_18013/g.68298  ORF Transcript_18013/g.68298 Transcript_18013/m.68298 type:complete len:205 (+) Transcript_18013:1063-1677(+)
MTLEITEVRSRILRVEGNVEAALDYVLDFLHMDRGIKEALSAHTLPFRYRVSEARIVKLPPVVRGWQMLGSYIEKLHKYQQKIFRASAFPEAKMVRMMTALSARELDAVARFYEVPALSSGRSKSDVLEEVTAVVRDSLEEVDMVGGLPLWNVFCTRRGRELYGQTKAALIREATRWECEITDSATKDILVYKILSASGDLSVP